MDAGRYIGHSLIGDGCDARLPPAVSVPSGETCRVVVDRLAALAGEAFWYGDSAVYDVSGV